MIRSAAINNRQQQAAMSCRAKCLLLLRRLLQLSAAPSTSLL
jgi:hypothetical protein